MGSWIDCCNGSAEIAPGHKAHNLYVRLFGPFFLDVFPVKVQLKWFSRGTASLKVKETIVRTPCTSSTPAIDKELMEVGAGSVRHPSGTGGPSPAGDNSAAANDRSLAVRCLPNGVAILRTKYQCL